jgi:hypothetical protein
MYDHPISVFLEENTVLSKWPLDSNVVVPFVHNPLSPFIDEVRSDKLATGSGDEPLFHAKVTHLMHSNEWVLGVSGSHMVVMELHF